MSFSLAWLDQHAGAVQALTAVIIAIVTVIYVILTNRLAVQATRQSDLIANRERAEHDAAVIAVFYELLSIAKPIELRLLHGTVTIVPFGFAGAYRSLVGPLHYRLPPALGHRLAKTFSLVEVVRSQLDSPRYQARQVAITYNDDIVPTLEALRAYAAERDIELQIDVAQVDLDELVQPPMPEEVELHRARPRDQ